MFGIKKLKRRINDLDISRSEWMKIAKTGIEEIKSLKNDIESIKDGMNKWMKIANDRLEEIKTLKEENDKLKSDVEIKDNTIKTLESEVDRLTRKRDAKGRFVKTGTLSEFNFGDMVKIRKGVNSKTAKRVVPPFKSDMDFHIGDVGEITVITEEGYIGVHFEGGTWLFHPDWLEHAE